MAQDLIYVLDYSRTPCGYKGVDLEVVPSLEGLSPQAKAGAEERDTNRAKTARDRAWRRRLVRVRG